MSQTIPDGATLSGVVGWRAHTVGPVARVQFLVDGAVIATPTTEPWRATWDATAAAGSHTLAVRALGQDGRVGATATVSVTVTAPPEQPPAQAPPAPAAPSP